MIKTVFALLVASALTGCGPKDPVPSGPQHPADPSAAEAPEGTPEPGLPSEPAPGGEPGHEHGAKGPEALIAAEMRAFEAARPVLEASCAHCHGAESSNEEALEHFSMAGGYPFTGHHAGEIGETVRKVLGVEGGEATMPLDDPGSVKGDELERVVAWTRAYDRAKEAGAGYHGDEGDHGHGGHGHARAE